MPEPTPSNSYEDDVPSAQTVSIERLERVGALAKEQLKHYARILELEALLAAEDAALNKVQGQELPALLNELGITEFKLKDETIISLDKTYAATISKGRQQAAHQWLMENGFGSLIKKVCTVALDVGDEKALSDLREWLAANKYDFAVDENVHWQTLKTFVKTQMETPAEEKPAVPPKELFGIFVADKTTVKNPNTKQQKRTYEKKK